MNNQSGTTQITKAMGTSQAVGEQQPERLSQHARKLAEYRSSVKPSVGEHHEPSGDCWRGCNRELFSTPRVGGG